ncbi:6134_t:CDS:1, partial [Paraglomus occultum]
GNVDTMNGQLNTPLRSQIEPHANPGPIPASFQTICGSAVPHSDMMTDNNFQRLGMNNNNTYVSYSLIPIPTSNEFIVMREERTQSVLGRISAASSIGEMLAM